MRAGDLRHRITLLRKESVIDDDGYSTDNWLKFGRPWAEKLAMGSNRRQYFAAAAINSEHQEVFRIRYRAGITAGMIVRFDGNDYDIKAVQDPDGKRRELHLICEVRSDG